ncbi:MAG: trigger factor [Bacillota bacterium]|jgi:trigger factor
MKATAEKIEKNIVVLEVEVEQDQINRAVNESYLKFVKKVAVPGFRKGKTPRVVLENYLGKGVLFQDALESLVPNAYIEAVKETGVEPVADPELEMTQAEEGKTIKFKATVKVKPEVDLGQYTGLEVARQTTEVTDEEVQAGLEKMREKYARLITVEDDVVQQGDMATIDYVGRVDGVEFEGGKGDEYALEIGSKTFIPGFEDQLVGAATGETRDIRVTFPEDYGKQELAGREAVFTVTVKGIKRKELAPLDDEFAKDVSEFDSLEELRASTLNNLKKAREDLSARQLKNAVLTKAVDNAGVDIPVEMIDSQIDNMYKNMERRLFSQGITMEQYLQYTGSSPEEVKNGLRDEAAKSLKTTLVLEAIGAREQVEVSDAEVEAEIQKMSEIYGQKPDILREILAYQGDLEGLKMNLQREKTLDLLVARANIVDQPAADTNSEGRE